MKEDAYLICLVPIYQLSVRKRQVNPPKIYCIDTGIISAYSIKPETDHAAQLENAVYIHLRYGTYDNIFYYKTNTGKEIDFIAQQINGEVSMIQVCVDLQDPATRQREQDAIVEAAQELALSEAIIVTTDQKETIIQQNVTISIIPFWEWALAV